VVEAFNRALEVYLPMDMDKDFTAQGKEDLFINGHFPTNEECAKFTHEVLNHLLSHPDP